MSSLRRHSRRRSISAVENGLLSALHNELISASSSACSDWAASGAMALTGFADGPAAPGATVRGAPAAALQAALAVLRSSVSTGTLPGVNLLGERAAIAGFTRNAPSSPGGSFRILPAADGWFGISLARDDDRSFVPALVQRDVPIEGDEALDAAWDAVAAWLRATPVAEAEQRTILLGMPAAAVPAVVPQIRRPPVGVTPGGIRRRSAVPLVVDLSAMWAGPLAAHLLGLTGARVIKIESIDRPDGARGGPPQFYDVLHSGHESVALDFGNPADLALLATLCSSADVVLEASRPRALRRLGIDAEQVASRGTAWVSITGYGRGGANGDRVGFGDDVASGAGLVCDTNTGPIPAGDGLADPLTGAVAAATAAFALTCDAAGQRGGIYDVSMHDVCRWAGSVESGDRDRDYEAAPPAPRSAPEPAAEMGAHTAKIRAEFARAGAAS